VIGDVVRNLAAEVPEDSGYSLDIIVGKARDIGDWQVHYGYSVVQTDAVLAAFSHDNTGYSTNYRQHTIGVDYIPYERTHVNATAYLFRRDNFELAGQPETNDLVSRFRVNLYLQF
jgi:hypothetical protein